jgi:hypothetical protein
MERLAKLLGRREDRLDFLRDLLALLLEDYDIYSEEALFRDAVEEVYSILRSAVVSEGRGELADAYVLAVLLRAAVGEGLPEPRVLLREILERVR